MDSASGIFQQRRNKVLAQLPNNSVAIIPGQKEIFRNQYSTYRFRQDSDFYYLTGFNEANAYLVLVKIGEQNKSILFNQVRDREKEQWTGFRLGQVDAPKVLGVDEAYATEKLTEKMLELLAHCEQVHYGFHHNGGLQSSVQAWLKDLEAKQRAGKSVPKEMVNLNSILHEMRLFKDPAEIADLRKAIDISAQAHIRLMQSCKSANNEYQLEAEFIHECYSQGCRALAYEPIVAAGKNACILHYIDNNSELDHKDLLLVDAGGEYNCYAADITRTYPLNGKFSPAQKRIYDLVLKSQLAAIDTLKPGEHWNKAQEVIVEILVEGLKELGILSGNSKQLIADKAYEAFYMHRSGHWLGMDVHDVGSYKTDDKWRKLEPGMVLTIEPGLYFLPDLAQVPDEYKGIGIRIEDDVLITKNGCEVLSQAVPKTVADIENLMAS